MNITLNDTEIRQALCEYASKRGITITGSDIKIIAGRGENGNRAEIDINLLSTATRTEEQTEKVEVDPVKTTGVTETDSPFATPPATEEVTTTVTEALEEKGAEVVKKPRKKRAKKDLFAADTPAETTAPDTPAVEETEDDALNRMRAETLAEEEALNAEDAALDAQTEDPKNEAMTAESTGETTPTQSLFQ